jgi:hypothetical protein
MFSHRAGRVAAQGSVCVPNFLDDAIAALMAARNDDGGWGYRAAAASATEPTSVALLALEAADGDADAREQAVSWLLDHQTAGGGFVSIDGHDGNGWTSGLALTALLRAGGDAASEAASASAAWMVDTAVFTLHDRLPDIFGYDLSLGGWAWTEGDFSFVEPTSFALIGLKQSPQRDHERVAQGEALLRDRFTTGGGWNYGEPNVLERDLPTQVAPTAVALLALQGSADATTDAATAYLVGQLPTLTATMSLGYAANALVVWELADADFPDLLEERWRTGAAGNLDTALLALACAPPERNGLVLL